MINDINKYNEGKIRLISRDLSEEEERAGGESKAGGKVVQNQRGKAEMHQSGVRESFLRKLEF